MCSMNHGINLTKYQSNESMNLYVWTIMDVTLPEPYTSFGRKTGRDSEHEDE